MNIDPTNEQLHRVPLVEITKYKAAVIAKVTAKCGKIWAPTYPIPNVGALPRCPVCFPTEPNRYALAN